MCGIAGFYRYKNDDLIKRFSRQLKHRGPDGEGYHIDEIVTLLIRRLAIIDLKGGDQPIYNEDKSVAVVYNGEIYNYRELRKELEQDGHIFKTQSDTEVIVHGYESWGDTCFDRFNGMFAIALYDIKKEKLLLARDHFGIKPLYYASVENEKKSVVFSSEIKPIFFSGLIAKKPNERVLYRYLKYRIHDDQEETFFDGIYRLMPGQMMTLQKGDIKKKYYSNLKKDLLDSATESRQSLSQEQISEFKTKLQDAVRLRLIADVPVGTCLSGGLDSSTVAALANSFLQQHQTEAQSLGSRQKTFSAVFPGSSNDEEKYIDELVQSLKKIQSYKVNPKPEAFFSEIEDFIKTQEEPTISTGPYAQYKVMELAQGKVTVLLDGQGADEMLAGYLPYYFVYLRQLRREGRLLKYFQEIIESKDVIGKYILRKFSSLRSRHDTDIDTLLNQEFRKSYTKEKFKVDRRSLKHRLIEDIFHNSLQSLLRYEDKNSMRFSIEGRVPFLDFNLMRFIFSLSDEAIIENGWNKNILRQAMVGLLPENILVRRNKIGFTTPEHNWFIRMKNRIYSIFLSESFGTRPYFNQTAVVKGFLKFIEGKNDDTLLFWRILNIELWLRAFFDTKKSSSDEKMHEGNKKDNQILLNEGKQIKIESGTQQHFRFPIRTDVFKKGDEAAQKVAKYTIEGLHAISRSTKYSKVMKNHWFVVVSEKVVAIAQGRSYFIWDIKPGMWANFLSPYVTRTPYGIGLGSPWTMQLAIQEVGLIRIMIAAIVAAITKPFGIKGAFYWIAGHAAASIDGPTEYSLYPSNVSAKLGPKNPKGVVRQAHNLLLEKLPKTRANTFRGVAIIDANDLGQRVLGNTTGVKNKLIEQVFKDNPMGQGSEQTPLVIVYEI